jgi:hypothetical protein
MTKSNTFLKVVAVSLARCTSSNMIMFELLIRSRLLIALWYVLIVISRTIFSNLLNCKISAFPSYTEYRGINRQSPNFIFIDLDLSHFGNREALDRCLSETLNTIKVKLNCAYPTVLWSGNGYHIYLPVEAPILEKESIFADLEEQPSRKFIQWAEKYLSNKKSDRLQIIVD